LGLFGKKKPDEAAGSGDSTTGAPGASGTAPAEVRSANAKHAKPVFEADPRKARRFFEHAQVVADSRNYDYAIECYINGLKHNPESMQHHEELRQVALRRKVGGGKPAGMKDRYTYGGGKTPIEKTLNAEYLWAKDPTNAAQALMVMELATKAELYELSYWIGGFVLEANRTSKKPTKAIYIKLVDLYEEMEAWDRAVECCRFAVMMDEGNMVLLKRLKDLEAELTLLKGQYGKEEGGFRRGVANMEKQKALEAEDTIAKTSTQLEETISRLRREYEENTEDLDKLTKFVRVLLEKEDETTDAEAIRHLQEAWERTGQYRFKAEIGNIKIKAFNRRTRVIKQAMTQATDDAVRRTLHEQLAALVQEQVRFELAEFTERVKNYPTDMQLLYQLGRRQFAMGDHDSAIASFQQAQADPKTRANALRYLGEAFYRKEWLDEAVDTFHRGIEVHPYSDDKLALELRYELCKALEAKARRDRSLEVALEADEVASKIVQADVNYRDMRQRRDSLRKLVSELRGQSGGTSVTAQA
jgi:tetratricopeptide (TPR) repeat protein